VTLRGKTVLRRMKPLRSAQKSPPNANQEKWSSTNKAGQLLFVFVRRLSGKNSNTPSCTMPLYEIETDAHIFITWADNEPAATDALVDAYPTDTILRLTRRPRNSWVISKSALGSVGTPIDMCSIARDCLSKSSGDKLHAIRLYMAETGSDLEKARRIIESNMVMGW